MPTVLHVSSSARGDESVSDLLARELIDHVAPADVAVRTRRLADGIPQLSVAAAFEIATPAAERSIDAADVLAVGDELIAELQAADMLVIGAPIYNFGPPAALKAWADLVARAGTTFNYSEQGPVGLLADRPAYIVAASGGTPIGSDLDYGTRWLRQFLAFLGITNVTVVGAEGLALDPAAGLTAARQQIADLAGAA